MIRIFSNLFSYHCLFQANALLSPLRLLLEIMSPTKIGWGLFMCSGGQHINFITIVQERVLARVGLKYIDALNKLILFNKIQYFRIFFIAINIATIWKYQYVVKSNLLQYLLGVQLLQYLLNVNCRSPVCGNMLFKGALYEAFLSCRQSTIFMIYNIMICDTFQTVLCRCRNRTFGCF